MRTREPQLALAHSVPGHDGFLDMVQEANKDLYKIKYVFGDHGAAIREDNWDAIADFIAIGTLGNESL